MPAICYCSQCLFFISFPSSSWESFVLKLLLFSISEWANGHRHQHHCCCWCGCCCCHSKLIHRRKKCVCACARHHAIQSYINEFLLPTRARERESEEKTHARTSRLISLYRLCSHLSLSWNHFSTELIFLIWQFFAMIRSEWAFGVHSHFDHPLENIVCNRAAWLTVDKRCLGIFMELN